MKSGYLSEIHQKGSETYRVYQHEYHYYLLVSLVVNPSATDRLRMILLHADKRFEPDVDQMKIGEIMRLQP